MSKGVNFRLKKNKIDVLEGRGRINDIGVVEVENENGKNVFYAKNIIIATGSHSRELPDIKIDGTKIIGYKQALSLNRLPQSMIVVGSGAIGVELAKFYGTLGTRITLVEYMPNILPIADEDVSKYMERTLKKANIELHTSSQVINVEKQNDSKCKVVIKTATQEIIKESEIVLLSVGITPNTDDIGIEEVGITTKNGYIIVDEYFKTNKEGIYAIGDVIPTPALAHVASAEAITCVEKIAGLNPKPLNYNTVPSCIFTSPEIASVGLTEKQAAEKGITTKIGRFPYTASGKAISSGHKDGFVKLIFNSVDSKLIGAHMIGANVTELISELALAINKNSTAHDIIKTIHPHPTMSEAIMEAAAQAYGEAIHV